MKLVIVDRSKGSTYDRMRSLFAGDPDVTVIWDRRSPDERRHQEALRLPERRRRERRHQLTEFGGRGFIVVDADRAERLRL